MTSPATYCTLGHHDPKQMALKTSESMLFSSMWKRDRRRAAITTCLRKRCGALPQRVSLSRTEVGACAWEEGSGFCHLRSHTCCTAEAPVVCLCDILTSIKAGCWHKSACQSSLLKDFCKALEPEVAAHCHNMARLFNWRPCSWST